MSNPSEVEENEVCVVDDDFSVLESIYYLLVSVGFKVRTFKKPEDFLDHARTHPVPVAVLDIWMDRMSGLEVLAHLCAISPKTRVIVVTAREDIAARTTAMAIGPVAYFMKPFDNDKLISAVREAFSQSARGSRSKS
jgi:FixJ family two-component response regulator